MGNVTKGQLKRANEQAKLAAQAAESIEQAGRGLYLVSQELGANTPTPLTVYNLGLIIGHVNQAQMLLLERSRHDNPEQENKLIVPSDNG